MRLPAGLALLLAVALSAPLRAQAHAEIVVGCDADGKLAVRFDGSKPYPVPGSRFYGIGGYAEVFPGFSCFFDAASAGGLLPAGTEADLAFVLEGADEGIAVWNDHGTATMKAGDLFHLGHPPFDSHPVWNIADGKPGQAYAVRMRLRDTTGRYRDSDVFAPTFTPDDATERFTCPMQCAGGAWYDAPGQCPECHMALKLLSGRKYRVTITPEGDGGGAGDGETAIRAGEPAALRFRIESPAGEPVKLEVVHEKLLHLLMVSDDLSWFAHEHPELQPDGTFTLSFMFPHGGGYTLYHDFTPARVGMQVVPVPVAVEGQAPEPVPLAPSTSWSQSVDGYTVELQASRPITTISMQRLVFRLARDGAPVTDLQPFLGAMGHLIVISQDRERFVHSHPLAPASGSVGAEPVSRGPEVVFSALFPAPGLYKAWGQFQHEGRVITAPFVFEVVPPR